APLIPGQPEIRMMTTETAVKRARFPLSPGRADSDNRIGFIASRCGASILERDDVSSNRHPTLAFCLRMIFPENRYPPFRIMLCQLWHKPNRRKTHDCLMKLAAKFAAR